MVFQVNCLPLDLFSDFKGIKAEINAIESVDKYFLKVPVRCDT